MKRQIKLLTYILIGFTLLYACDDILEEDITNDVVIVTAPTSGQIVQGNVTEFSWQSLDGADEYRLQVLASDQQIITDSIVSNTSLNLNLLPGQYQWRVKGRNFAC